MRKVIVICDVCGKSDIGSDYEIEFTHRHVPVSMDGDNVSDYAICGGCCHTMLKTYIAKNKLDAVEVERQFNVKLS